MSAKPQNLFEAVASETLDKALAVLNQRGGEYSDTLRTCQFHVARATLEALDMEVIPREHIRAIVIAGLVDLKYERNSGGYKDDNIIDLINYAAALPGLIEIANESERKKESDQNED